MMDGLKRFLANGDVLALTDLCEASSCHSASAVEDLAEDDTSSPRQQDHDI